MIPTCANLDIQAETTLKHELLYIQRRVQERLPGLMIEITPQNSDGTLWRMVVSSPTRMDSFDWDVSEPVFRTQVLMGPRHSNPPRLLDSPASVVDYIVLSYS